MSHLHEILNHNPSRPQSSKLSEDTAPVVDQLEISSSAEDDISGFEDDEIDELDEESEDDLDFYDEEPSSATPPASATATEQPSVPPHHAVENLNGTKMEPKTDSFPMRQDEKRAEPAPRRKHEKHDRKIDLGLHDHKAHADCPDTLACLPDTHGRPQHTLPVILRCAILGSPRKRLTIREIYATMESKYPYYKTAGQTWKQSVRHHLSLNRLFERQPRPVTDPGFGSYWTVNLAAPPGTKRPRKRGRPNKDALEGTVSKKSGNHKAYSGSQPQLESQPVKFQFQPQSHPPPPPPPLPQPQVNTLTPRASAPHHHHALLPMPPRRSSPLPQYHSPPPSHPPQMQVTPTIISLQPHPTPPPSQSKIQHHQNQYPQHNYSHPNQNHRQSIPYSSPAHISLPPPEQPHSSSLSPPPLPPPPLPPSHHAHLHYQQYPRQDSYHSHQRPEQHHHPQYSASQQPSQNSSGYSSSLGASHNHSLPPRQHDLHRQSSITYPQRKASTHLPISSARESVYPLSSSRGSETEDGAMEVDSGIRNGPTVSDEEEYESEEDVNHRYQRRPGGSAVFIPSKPSPIFALPPFSVLSPPHRDRDDLLEQMRQEIAMLRRTSAEAVSTSIRLSEQLANANLEVSRSREAVRDLEDMLQDEASKRKEAEKLRGVEMERRRAAEDVLSGTLRSPTRVRAAT